MGVTFITLARCRWTRKWACDKQNKKKKRKKKSGISGISVIQLLLKISPCAASLVTLFQSCEVQHPNNCPVSFRRGWMSRRQTLAEENDFYRCFSITHWKLNIIFYIKKTTSLNSNQDREMSHVLQLPFRLLPRSEHTPSYSHANDWMLLQS